MRHDPLLLALDTSSDTCSVALERDGEVFERHALRPREHTQLLLPMIGEVLAEAGAAVSDLDAIAPGIGPGSFIGVRIAVSVAQGMAFAAERPVVPVSSLAAVAAEAFASSDAERVVVAQDAHMQQVYVAFFLRGRDGLPEAAGEASLHDIAPIEALSDAGTGGWHAAGAAWERLPRLSAHNQERLAGILPVHYPRARFMLALAAAAIRDGEAVAPDRLAPAYLRHEVAKVP